jgi:hypothetical protein
MKKRWIVTVEWYRSSGNEIKKYEVDELHELIDIVECGPHFYSLAKMTFELNPLFGTNDLDILENE